MPLYDLECVKCGECKKDVLITIKQMENYQCSCGNKMVPQIKKVSFRLAGSGWYSDGYAITESEMAKNNEESKKLAGETED